MIIIIFIPKINFKKYSNNNVKDVNTDNKGSSEKSPLIKNLDRLITNIHKRI